MTVLGRIAGRTSVARGGGTGNLMAHTVLERAARRECAEYPRRARRRSIMRKWTPTPWGNDVRKLPGWLADAVFYQIYPQSFADSNGDGIGDLPGLMDRLDYVQWLGVNTIWINPCFVSEFGDA